MPLFDATGRGDRAAPPSPNLYGPAPPPSLSSPSSLFVADPSQQFAGIYCLFGQRGIIAEAHFDSTRNAIAMARGRKRYVLAPPSQCGAFSLMTHGPAKRHSTADFTTPAGIAAVAAARALEVVLEPGEVLYLPTFWLHFIVSLSTNAVCNTRSGTPTSAAVADLLACGFDMTDTQSEPQGQLSAVGALPLHHAVARAVAGLGGGDSSGEESSGGGGSSSDAAGGGEEGGEWADGVFPFVAMRRLKEALRRGGGQGDVNYRGFIGGEARGAMRGRGAP